MFICYMKVGTLKKDELDRALVAAVEGKPRVLLEQLCRDAEVSLWQNQANHVSIVRLGFNDHGPVHMRIVTLHALRILQLLQEGGVRSTLEFEKLGSYEDAQVVLVLAGASSMVPINVRGLPGARTSKVALNPLPAATHCVTSRI